MSSHKFFASLLPTTDFFRPAQGDSLSVTPGYAAAKQLRFLVLSCNGWADFLSNPVTAFVAMIADQRF